MKITYLLLKNYKRLPLRDSKIFEAKFENKLTMISGPNGSGKSSIFNELTPLPSDSKDFNQDGYKEIHIEHRGKSYVLISDFTSGNKFSFQMDGEELNKAGIVTSQRVLVEQHFNITQVTHDLFVGKETLTDLSLNNRKKLFNTITHLNIDVVIEFYNNKKIELRDQTNLLKSQYALLKSEENKLLDEDRTKDLKNIVKNTREYIDYLYNLGSELKQYTTDSDNHDKLVSELEILKVRYRDLLHSDYLTLSSTELNNLADIRTNLQTKRSMLSERLQQLYDELAHRKEAIAVLDSTKDKASIEEYVSRKESLIRKRNNIEQSLIYVKEADNLQSKTEAVMAINSSLPDICDELPVNRDSNGELIHSRDTGLKLMEDVNKLSKLVHDEDTKYFETKSKLDHIRSHDDNVTCPQCTHSWSPSGRQEQIVSLSSEIKTLLESQSERREQLKKLNEDLEETRRVFDLHRRYYNVKNTTKDTIPSVWLYIDSNDVLHSNPTEIPYITQQAYRDVLGLSEMMSIDKEITSIDEQLKLLETVKQQSLDGLRDQYHQVEQSVYDLQSQVDDIDVKLDQYSRIDHVYRQMTQLASAIEICKDKIRTDNLSYTVKSLLDDIRTEMTTKKVLLVENETALKEQDSINYTINSYKKNIAKIEEEVKILKIITDELSPKSGIIARSVSGFLNMIIMNVNNTIRSIWDYKMELVPIDVDTDALNYRFKVNVEDKLTINDVNTVSKGMGEIINLSFKLVLYKLLGIDHPPLFMDELGSHLDKRHTDKIVWLINQLTMSDEYSQLFLISHKENFGFIRDIDIIETI